MSYPSRDTFEGYRAQKSFKKVLLSELLDVATKLEEEPVSQVSLEVLAEVVEEAENMGVKLVRQSDWGHFEGDRSSGVCVKGYFYKRLDRGASGASRHFGEKIEGSRR